MPDLLEEKPTPTPAALPMIDNGPLLSVMQALLSEIRKAHPNQRAIVVPINGASTFPSETNIEVIFMNMGKKVKSHHTYISNNCSDDTLWYSFDAPVTFNTPALNAYQLPHGANTQISDEIEHLYLYIHHGGGAATYAINNSDQGSANQIIKIDAYTNPEDSLNG
jgi:hypothetical protein